MIKFILTAIISITAFNVHAQLTKSEDKISFEKGDSIFQIYCLACHQKNGAGVPGLNPSLIHASYVVGEKKQLIQWVLHGTQEKKPLEGEMYSNNMPPQSFLNDEQIADVLTYVRNSFGNKESVITVSEVKAQRAELHENEKKQ